MNNLCGLCGLALALLVFSQTLTPCQAYVSTFLVRRDGPAEYIEVRPGERLVISFDTLDIETNAPREVDGVCLNICMETAYRFVPYRGPLTPIPGSTNSIEMLARDMAAPAQVELELFENKGDQVPVCTRRYAPDGARGVWSGVDSESLWRDREGFLVIKPLDAAVRVYGYNLVRVIQSVTYSTGIRWLSKPENSNFAEAKPGEAHLEQTESAGRIPVGTIVGLTCGKAAANDSLSATLAVAADPGKGYQLQSCRDLSAGIWTAEGVIVYSTDTSVQFSIPVDCDAVYYRVMAVNP